MNPEDPMRHSDAMNIVSCSARALFFLAAAADSLGNDRLRRKLRDIASDLEIAETAAEAAYTQASIDRFHDTQLHSAAMLATICHLGTVK